MTCRVCDVSVPSDEFCGNCGATTAPRPGDGPPWLRLTAYAAAPRQHVWRPAVASTIFPALPRRSRTVFAIALAVVIALMLGSAVPAWLAALIGLVCFGLPLTFVAYLKETDAFTDMSGLTLVATAGLGAALGVGWGFATDAATAATEDDALGLPVSALKILVVGLAIPLSFLFCLLAPMLLMRWWRPGTRESLDGFAIGALGALFFVGAGNLTRLAAQLTAGPVDTDGGPPEHLVFAAAIQGVAIPLTAAAVGGALGATLWYVRRPDADGEARWYWLTSPWPALAFGVAIYLGLGLLDFFALPTLVERLVYACLAVVAFYLLRIVLHCTLLHERPDEPRPDVTVTCPQCDHEVPSLTFCPHCGVARHAASRTSRAARAVATPPARLVAGVAAVAVLVMTASAAVSSWLKPPEALVVCPPDCGTPPISKPVATNPRFTPAGGEFSVSYPGEGTAYDATFDPNGVVLDLKAGDGGTLRLFGQPANGQTPRQIADGLLKDHYPDATFAYEIPNAFVGYELGYGEVADDRPAGAIGDDDRNRVLIMVAVKNDYALVAAAAGPYREYSPEFGSGHPSGANFFLALDMAKYVNSFRWRGDPPR
jgi:hypothetical protein